MPTVGHQKLSYDKHAEFHFSGTSFSSNETGFEKIKVIIGRHANINKPVTTMKFKLYIIKKNR